MPWHASARQAAAQADAPVGQAAQGQPQQAPKASNVLPFPGNSQAAPEASREPSGQASSAPSASGSPSGASPHRIPGPATWKGFHHYLREHAQETGRTVTALGHLKGEVAQVPGGHEVTVVCLGDVHLRQLQENQENRSFLHAAAVAYFGPGTRLAFEARVAPVTDKKALKARAEQEPLFKEAEQLFGARIMDVFPKS